jgi:FG-GAP-like repeat
MNSTDQISHTARVSRRRMLVLGGIAAGTGLLAAARGAWADTPTPTPLEPGLATLSTPTPAPGLATLTTPAAVATPAALATVAPRPTPTDVLAEAARLGVDASRMTLPQQYPTWKDSDGWNQPRQYKTIQLADIDGDGQAELLGRGANGIQVYHWNKTTHLWDALALEGPLTDKQGWDQEQYYLTIRLGDIDGDKQAELVTRDSTGFETYHWNKAAGGWDTPSYTTYTNNGDWDQPQYYATIQLADIDGDGKLELLGRGPDGLHFWSWDGSTWVEVEAANGSSYFVGWDKQSQYSTIQCADFDGDGQAEVIGRGPGSSGLTAVRWNKQTSEWDLIEPPAGQLAGWNDPQYFTTIQFVDIDGDGQATLVGRGSGGIEFWSWAGSPNNANGFFDRVYGEGTQAPLILDYFSDTNNWDQPQNYSTIQFADVNRDGKAELIARGPDGLVAWSVDSWSENFGVPTGAWSQMAGPAGIMTDGWDAPQSYLTIQAADVDGDGAFEIVGRGSDGIQTWKWGSSGASDVGPRLAADAGGVTMAGMMAATGQQATSGPTPTPINPPLAGVTPVATATNPPPARLTPVATSTNPPPATLTPIPTSTNPPPAVLTPVATATNPSLAALTPAPPAATATPTGSDRTGPPVPLVAPPPVIGFRDSATNGFYQPAVPGFPDYSTIPGQLLSYQRISQYLLVQLPAPLQWPPDSTWPSVDPAEPQCDIRGQYNNTLLTPQWPNFAKAVAGLEGKTPPAGVSASDFETVRQQLYTELIYVNNVNIWFDKIGKFLNDLFAEDKMSVHIVAGYLELSTASDTEVILNWLSLAAYALSDLVALAASIVDNTEAEIIGEVVSLTATAFAMGATATGSDTLAVQVLHLETQLLHSHSQALSNNAAIQTAYLQHWPLLQKLGEPIENLTLEWPAGFAERLARQGRRGYELWLWQTLTPAAGWYVDGHYDKPDEKYTYHYTNAKHCPDGDWLFMQHDTWTDPPSASMDLVFGTPTTGPDGDPSGPLGASFEDAVLSRNGWNLAPYTESECSLPSVQERLEEMLLRHRRANPAPRPQP